MARRLGIETHLYNVKHQAFITRRLPPLGVNGAPLPMMIDRQKYKGVLGCLRPAARTHGQGDRLRITGRRFGPGQ